MRRRRIFPNGTGQQLLPSAVPHSASRPEELPEPRQSIDIDEVCASPWVGLHYRHEFLLHHRHELLVPQPEGEGSSRGGALV